jgi:hypothetical protein
VQLPAGAVLTELANPTRHPFFDRLPPHGG